MSRVRRRHAGPDPVLAPRGLQGLLRDGADTAALRRSSYLPAEDGHVRQGIQGHQLQLLHAHAQHRRGVRRAHGLVLLLAVARAGLGPSVSLQTALALVCHLWTCLAARQVRLVRAGRRRAHGRRLRRRVQGHDARQAGRLREQAPAAANGHRVAGRTTRGGLVGALRQRPSACPRPLSAAAG